ncbi:MAG: hypothetical protein IKJ68_12815 [Clostridia bacterium]|nr:hypothetical protein [Clostridia bacterium]
MNKDIIYNGVHIGEHSFVPENILNELYERCVKTGCNFVTIRTGWDQVEPERFYEWAKYLSKNKIYFVFLYTMQHAPDGKESQFTKEIVERIKEIAGDYFLGDMIGETGSTFACKFPGYYKKGTPDAKMVELDCGFPNMKSAEESYIKSVSKYIKTAHSLGMPNVFSVEATALNKYNAKLGVDVPCVELMCANPDIMLPSLRGVARGFENEFWGTYIAHEWYGGLRQNDTLKRKRLEIAYKLAYISGSSIFCLESGDELVTAYGTHYESDSEICKDYQNIITYMNNLIKNDNRPGGGPRVKLAFISGNHDAWGGWGGSSVWSQFFREEWGHGEAEHSWRLLDEIGTKRQWNDIANYGEQDLSTFPAYGMYDIIPVESTLEAMKKYEYLIFLGWNTMTDDVMDKLIAYTENGGKILLCASHLNCLSERNSKIEFPSAEKLKRLFGVEFTGEFVSTNDGAKFEHESLNKDMLYPGTKSMQGDPIYSSGYVKYAIFNLCGGRTCAYLNSSFLKPQPDDIPMLIENKVGNGVASLVTSVNYPGHPALYPFYRALVREWITSSNRNCDIKVLGSERLRYSVYDGGKIYLLNTDFDMPIIVKVINGKKETLVELNPLELKIIE